MQRTCLLMVCVLAVVSVVVASPVQTETVGEWRDYVNASWDHNLRIIREANGTHMMVVTPSRGESFRRRLVVRGDDNFQVLESDEGYRITRNGDLVLYDREGDIRTARKVER